jgi:DNA-binding PadR family transcriptional regulator
MVLHALARGHRHGFAKVAQEQKRPPRRYFEITAEGKRELIAALERYRALAPVSIDGVKHPPTEDPT